MEGEQISSSQLAHLLAQRFHGSSSVEGPMSIADVSRRIASVVQARADARAGKYRPRVNTASVQADMDKLHICICGKLAGRHEHWSLVLWEVRSGRNGIKVRIIDPSEPENVVSLTSNLTALGIAPIVTHLDRECDRWRCGYWCCWALETVFANVDRWQSIEIPPMPDRYEMIVRNIVLQREMQALQRLAERSATRVLSGASSTAPSSRRNSVSSIAQAIETLSGCKGGYLDVCNASVCSTSPRHGGHMSPNAMAMGRGSPRPTDDISVSPRPYPSDAGEEDGSHIAPSHDGSQDESNESTLPPSPFEAEDRSGASMAPGHLDTSSLEQNDTASVQKSEDCEEPQSPRPEDFRSPSYSPSKATFEAGGMNGMMGMSNPGEAALNSMGGMNPMMMSQMMASGMNPMMMQMMMAGMMNGGGTGGVGGGMGGMPGMVGASMMSRSSAGSTASSRTPYDDNMFEKGFSRGNAFDSQYAPSAAGRGGRKFNIWDAYDTAFVPSPMAMMGMGMPNMMQMQMMMNMGAMGNGMGGMGGNKSNE